MNIKYATIAVALLCATPALSAQDVISNGQFKGNWASPTVWTTNGTTSTGTLKGQAAKLGSGSAFGIIAQSFTLANPGKLKFSFDFATTKSLSVLLTSSTGFLWAKDIGKNITDSFSKNFNLDAGTYTLSFKSKGATVDNVSARFTAVTAVPGPEAGAGIGALAMGGMALYLKRRRKDENLAA
ncbi:hypothetical protein [Oryzifoliimicrobium ureilyticus]|uniref:hypothetical protein n=1 Tax=Oryzifoliimicrobium ureilyticus TaxID=3113724 RepID=UPI0030762BFE